MKNFFKAIYYIIIIAVVFVALLIIISAFPINGNIKMFTVLSGSMEPKIHTGSAVIIKPFSNYKIGDVVTFGKTNKTDIPTTHRIVEEKIQDGEKVFSTKGDANNSNDSLEVLEKDILGKVLFSMHYLGYLIDFVQKPIGFMIMIIIPAIVIVYNQLQKIFKEVNKLKLEVKKDEEIIEEMIDEKKENENKS